MNYIQWVWLWLWWITSRQMCLKIELQKNFWRQLQRLFVIVKTWYVLCGHDAKVTLSIGSLFLDGAISFFVHTPAVMRRNTRLWRRDSFLQFYIRAITANEWLDWKLRTIILSQDQKYIAFSSGPILFRTSALLLSDSVMILSLTTSMFPAAGCCLAELQQGARALCPCPLGAGPRWTRRRSGRQTPPSPPAPSCPSWTPLLALAGQPEQQGGRGTQGSCRLTLAPSRATHGQLVGGMVVVLLLARRPPQHWLRTAPASNCCLSSLLRCVRYVHYARTQTGNSRLKFGKLAQALDFVQCFFSNIRFRTDWLFLYYKFRSLKNLHNRVSQCKRWHILS